MSEEAEYFFIEMVNIYTIKDIITVISKEIIPTMNISQKGIYDDIKFDYIRYTAWLYYRELYSRLCKLIDFTPKTVYYIYYNCLNKDSKDKINNITTSNKKIKDKIFRKRNEYISHTNYQTKQIDFNTLHFSMQEVDEGIIFVKEIRQIIINGLEKENRIYNVKQFNNTNHYIITSLRKTYNL